MFLFMAIYETLQNCHKKSELDSGTLLINILWGTLFMELNNTNTPTCSVNCVHTSNFTLMLTDSYLPGSALHPLRPHHTR